MKKIAILAFVIAAVGGGYTGASWYFGKQTESTLAAQYDKVLQNTPYIEIVERDYQRGIFESEETVTLELFKQLTDAAAASSDPEMSANAKPLRLTVHTLIQHGPFPGFSTLAAATTYSEVTLPESIQQEAKQLLQGKSPFSQHTTIQMDGSGYATFSSPEFTTTLPGPNGDSAQPLTITWQGLEGGIHFSADMKKSQLSARAPELHMINQDEVDVRISDIRLEGDQQQIFDDISLLYAGTQRMSIGELAISVPNSGKDQLVMKQLAYDVDLPHSDGFIDLVERLSIDSVMIGQDAIGPVHFDYSFKHLHARTVAEISQAFMGIYADPTLLNGDSQAFAEKLMPVMMEKGVSLLSNQPEFHIDRISLANSQGEVSLKGRVKLNQENLEQAMANPMMLLTQLEASGELSLQEQMVLGLLSNPPGKEQMENSGFPTEEMEAKSQMLVAQFQQQVAMLTDQGYLTREGDLLKSNAVFKQGQLLVNGKPFPPMAPPGAMDDDPMLQ
jgi:uncharacterized protein YdgA (DUF945 family)